MEEGEEGSRREGGKGRREAGGEGRGGGREGGEQRARGGEGGRKGRGDGERERWCGSTLGQCSQVLCAMMLSSSFLKIIKCGGSDDGVTLRSQDSGDTMGVVIENAGTRTGHMGVWPN